MKKMNKTLICYFSATGTTKEVAQIISKEIGGDLFEIEPVQKYTSEDLDWTNKQSRTSLEMHDDNARPSIKNKVENLENYDNIIIAFPVWWYKEPNIIDTFIEENNLKNKNLYVFVTSGGSTVTDSYNSLKNKYPNLNFVNGEKFSRNVTPEEIHKWLGK